MASSGYCSNTTVCRTAAAKRVVDLKLNRDHCPDCGMMLHAIADMESLRSEVGAPRVSVIRNGATTVSSVTAPDAATPVFGADFSGFAEAAVSPAPLEPVVTRTARTEHFSDAPPQPPPAPVEPQPAPGRAPSRPMLLVGAVVAVVLLCAGTAWAVFGRAAVATPALAICGSNLLGGNLGIGLAQGFLEGAGGTKIGVRPLDASGQASVSADIAGGSQQLAVRADGASRAYEQIAAGTCGVAIVDRPPTPGELAALRAHDSGAPAGLRRTLAFDAIAIVVNPSNPVSHLTLAQVRRIFSGAATSWSDVGGPARPIAVLGPPDDSDVAGVVVAGVLDGQRIPGSVRRLASQRALSGTVAHDLDAIGLVPFSDSSPAKTLALGRIDTFVAPSALSIGKTYPLTLTVGLYGPVGSANAMANRFVAYLGTADARNVIGNAGLVPAGP